MAKSTNKRAAALNAPAAKGSVIGDNSGNGAPSEGKEVNELMKQLAKLGNESRTTAASANQLQLKAGLAFGAAVKAGTIKLDPMADSDAAVKAFAPHLWCVDMKDKRAQPFKALRSQLRSFADAKVLECASYDHIDAARNGKDFFQAAYKLNVAIKNANVAKPNVNAAFTAAALVPAKPRDTTPDRSKAGLKKSADRAMKALLNALAAFKAKSIRNAVADLTPAQFKVLESAVESFVK